MTWDHYNAFSGSSSGSELYTLDSLFYTEESADGQTNSFIPSFPWFHFFLITVSSSSGENTNGKKRMEQYEPVWNFYKRTMEQFVFLLQICNPFITVIFHSLLLFCSSTGLEKVVFVLYALKDRGNIVGLLLKSAIVSFCCFLPSDCMHLFFSTLNS